jgi:hypothetical protein
VIIHDNEDRDSLFRYKVHVDVADAQKEFKVITWILGNRRGKLHNFEMLLLMLSG